MKPYQSSQSWFVCLVGSLLVFNPALAADGAPASPQIDARSQPVQSENAAASRAAIEDVAEDSLARVEAAEEVREAGDSVVPENPNGTTAALGGDVGVYDVAPCGGDGIVNLDDLLGMLAAFGGNYACNCPGASVVADYVNGVTGGSIPMDLPPYRFIGVTTTVTIAAGDKLFVSANLDLGSTHAGGAQGLRLSIGQRISGSGANPADILSDYLQQLRVPQNTTIPISLSAVFESLPAGTYEVGMVGYCETAGQAANWNVHDWSRVSTMVFKP